MGVDVLAMVPTLSRLPCIKKWRAFSRSDGSHPLKDCETLGSHTDYV